MLALTGISKSFGALAALDQISFGMAPGRLTGFVGRNGAGKTTAMRIILGVLAADAGEVALDGRPVTAADRRGFGYMPEERGLYPKMKVAEQVAYLARLHGLSRRDALARALVLLERLGLGERAGDLVETLSLGNQQRAQIAAALVHEPEILILDEPFSGLDPFAVDLVAGVLAERAAGGAAVLFSSHQLELVERLCDDLVIIAQGTIRAAGGRAELREQFATNRYELALNEDADTGWVGAEPGILPVELRAGFASFDASSPAAAQQVLRRAVEQNTVVSFGRVQPSLVQIFKEAVS
ncbi:MAG: ATP-binding cassette domain-containing protein [Propionicimonas sp.]|uniref:ABC transporter ATP-binding protein n=1 Tax=Propionicimonas sp. TaxID=1955623 RepID=UPI002B2201A9|nr:ATP-binding cassette domain-containing protein [Propionicimonas sp.]MEA4943568.1 ATP-binding cassette domain-containing protein [Propionicimonas sp.]MEA5054754.1 ATP-binding cassette domain-containing protein [Propionicimonas sp.]